MPIYEYECVECGTRIERLQRLNDPAPAACEACQGALRKLISAPAFQFKGSGWYVTDYANKSGGKSADAEGGGDAQGSSQGDSQGKSTREGDASTKDKQAAGGDKKATAGDKSGSVAATSTAAAD